MNAQASPLAPHTSAVQSGHCAIESCAEPAVAQLETQSFCMQHFVARFMREAESRNERLRSGPFDAAAAESFKKLLADCAAQAKELLDSEQNLALPGKERLLDILVLTSQLHQRLRRSPRTTASVPIWLRRDDPGQTWEEATWTSSISRHGAGLVCRHRVEPGRTVYLCRKDRGGRAQARVVYSHFDAAGDRQIGVEILDRNDFWDASELAPAASQQNTRPEVVEPPPSSAPASSSTIHADVAIQLAGQRVEYKHVPLEFVKQGNEIHLSGTILATLADLKIDPASLPAAHSNDEIPVRIDMTWRTQN